MSKVNVIIVNGRTFEVNADTLKSIEVICSAFGKEVKTTKDQPKVSTKAEPKPQPKAEKQTKKSDTFDRKAYEAISREFGCWSERKSTCYKKCRDTVYAVMNGTMTKAKGKAEVKKILATEYGIK